MKVGALAGFSVGDVVNIGSKGYVAMTGGACGFGDCLWEVALGTGARIGAAPLGTIPSTQHVTSLGHWAGKLYAFSAKDEGFRIDPANPGAPMTFSGPPGYISVTYHGAGSTTIAPTQ